MNEIASASTEQSSGIDQLNTGMSQMDQVVQSLRQRSRRVLCDRRRAQLGSSKTGKRDVEFERFSKRAECHDPADLQNKTENIFHEAKKPAKQEKSVKQQPKSESTAI
ncbi:MAG: hypothetical protein U5J62_02250 [Desulfurivibrio sp.]|nr:hypothetical protein [Desulfurivibrio sp.]